MHNVSTMLNKYIGFGSVSFRPRFVDAAQSIRVVTMHRPSIRDLLVAYQPNLNYITPKRIQPFHLYLITSRPHLSQRPEAVAHYARWVRIGARAAVSILTGQTLRAALEHLLCFTCHADAALASFPITSAS